MSDDTPGSRVRVRAKAHPGITWQSRVGDIVERLLAGTPLEPACVLAQVSSDVLREAMGRGDEDAQPIVEALAAYEAEMAAVATKMAREGKPHGAVAFVLERRFPKRWRAETKTEVTGADDGPVMVQEAPTEEQLRERLARIQAKLGT